MQIGFFALYLAVVALYLRFTRRGRKIFKDFFPDQDDEEREFDYEEKKQLFFEYPEYFFITFGLPVGLFFLWIYEGLFR